MHQMNEIYQATRNRCINHQEQAARFHHLSTVARVPSDVVDYQKMAQYHAREAWIRLERLI